VVDFLVQVADFQFRFQIHFVIVLGAQAVPRFGPVLAHHDDRRLNRGPPGRISASNFRSVKRKSRQADDQQCL
jgi:hypothetical protein